MPATFACVHVRDQIYQPASIVRHLAVSGARSDLDTLTELCPICSGILVTFLGELETLNTEPPRAAQLRSVSPKQGETIRPPPKPKPAQPKPVRDPILNPVIEPAHVKIEKTQAALDEDDHWVPDCDVCLCAQCCARREDLRS